ncbi:MAG: hydroxymethylbilane synthase [Chloroflexi bacterium]|nr:hydroxymethylbilane synthase [Chloroflexota bacterium]
MLGPLRAHYPKRRFVVVPVTTRGDRRKDAPLLSLGRGMFAEEIERALLDGEIDFAVHSAKDVPSDLPDGLTLATFGERKDPRDVIVTASGRTLDEMPAGARLGTSSPRRTAQIKVLRPDVEIVPIRGNVGTRIEKAKGPGYDGVVLAAAGLLRLGMEDEITEYLSPDVCTPDVGQGALAVEARTDDGGTIEMLSAVDHVPTTIAVTAERAFLAEVEGGCQVPVAAYARFEDGRLHISAMAVLPDSSRIYRVELDHDPSDPQSAGRQTARMLLDSGAAEIVIRGVAQ